MTDETRADPGTDLLDDATAPLPQPAGSAPLLPAALTAWGASLVEWGLLILGAIIIALVIKSLVFQAFYIPSESMEPTLNIDDRVLVNRLSYRFHDPERGDIVVFEAPEGEATAEIRDLVKRIVGMPGEVIEMRDGIVYIDGREVEEPYVKRQSTKSFAACRVPVDAYFMMGDNRDRSKDSRYFGPVARSDLVGRVFVRIWPFDDISFYLDGPRLATTPERLPTQASSDVPVCGALPGP